MIKFRFKNYIFLITYSIILFFSLLNFSWIWGIICKLISIMIPFIYGFIIAYLINWPYNFFRTNVYKNLLKGRSSNTKLVNILSIISAYTLIFGLFAFLLIIIVPQLIISIHQFIDNFSRYSSSLSLWIDDLNKRFKVSLFSTEYAQLFIKNLSGNIDNFTADFFPNIFNFTRSFAMGIYNWIIGIIISFYFIGSKDKLINQLRLIASAYIPEQTIDNALRILKLSHETFGKFLVGKSLDSLIIGVLCFIGMTVLKIPYSVLVSVVIGITNIIPFFGPFIGAIPCVFILLIVDHIKALWFAIFIFILQQADGNIIGPRVLGNSVGISGMWIMFSVIIGGGLFGVLGMVIGVPAFAVIYTVIGENIKNRNSNSENC